MSHLSPEWIAEEQQAIALHWQAIRMMWREIVAQWKALEERTTLEQRQMVARRPRPYGLHPRQGGPDGNVPRTV